MNSEASGDARCPPPTVSAASRSASPRDCMTSCVTIGSESVGRTRTPTDPRTGGDLGVDLVKPRYTVPTDLRNHQRSRAEPEVALSPAAFAAATTTPQPTPAGSQQPTGSTAEKPNNGGYNRSSEASHKAIDCANYNDLFNSESNAPSRAQANGDAAAAKAHQKEADGYEDILVRRGCSF